MNQKPTLLIDGNNILHRAHWVTNSQGKQLLNSKGDNVGSVFTFLKILKSYAEKFNTDQICLIWDKKLQYGLKNFRQESTNGSYKGNRDPEKNKGVYDNADLIAEVAGYLGVKSYYPGRLEADDVINWLASTIEGNKIIISADKDFAQLVNTNISLFNPVKKQLITIENFESIFELTPKEFLYYKAIVGDTSDNIAGIEGVGKVRGVKLAKAYNAYVNNNACSEKDILTIKNNENLVLENLKLVDLSYGIKQYNEELELYESQRVQNDNFKSNFDKFKEVCVDLEFNSILDYLDTWKSTFNKPQMNALFTEYFKMFE
jgi:5'-3' exonuclease